MSNKIIVNAPARISSEEKLQEALKRMKTLNINEEAVLHFADEGIVPICFHGVDKIYGIDPKALDRIKQFEARHNALVYFVIFLQTAFGDLESYLFVSDYEEEWEMENADLLDGYVMTWTENLTYPQCSEFGSISFRKTPCGGLERVG